MRASLNWLKEFVDFSLTPEELSHALTMAGLEVEGTEELENDILFDIGITPNRPDCLSIKGIAREISAITGLPLKDTPTKIENEYGEGPVIEINAPQLCPRYASRVIYGVKIAQTPEWIAKRLESHGIRTTCNIVDITNYVLLELGHPLHAFDLDKLSGGKIIVELPVSTIKFQTLDGEDRTLSKEALLIWDAEKPVAIAGIMGGLTSEVTSNTVNILLESAYFNPVSIRRSSKALNLTTESSYRFERGTDINGITNSLDRAAQLIAELAGGNITKITDIYPEPFTTGSIKVKHEKINSVIGIEIDKARVQQLLKSLRIKSKREGAVFIVTPPGFRRDLQSDIDIIEEIVRLYGYDNIPITLPSIKMHPVPDNRKRRVIKTIRSSMVKSGFSEAVNLSFLNPLHLDKLNIASDDKRRNIITIKNPLKKEEGILRTTLVPALLGNAVLNINRGEKALSLFEISKVFFSSGQKLPDEVMQMAAVYCKDRSASLWQEKHDGFFDMKGAVENLMCELKIRNYSFVQEKSSTEPYLHPGKSCSIIIDGGRIGSIGALYPTVAQNFDLAGDIIFLEISDLDKLVEAVPQSVRYTPLPKYPYIERDISIVVLKSTTAAALYSIILKTSSDIIESVKLFDIYTGKQISSKKKSLSFSIRYRAVNRTLTDSEVDTLHSKILKRLETEANAELRS